MQVQVSACQLRVDRDRRGLNCFQYLAAGAALRHEVRHLQAGPSRTNHRIIQHVFVLHSEFAAGHVSVTTGKVL